MAWNYDDLQALGPDAKAQAVKQLSEKNQPKENKYHAVKTVCRGIKFDSAKEARRFEELMLLLEAGKIQDLRLQRNYTLQEAYTTPEGERIREIIYRADFAYERYAGKDPYGYDRWVKVVEDVKSPATRKKRDYIIKRKLFHEIYKFSITEV